jgi:hypothetical protein
MSDEALIQPTFSDGDECATTQREPGGSTPGLPARGVALSVLWWLETDDDGADGARVERSAS